MDNFDAQLLSLVLCPLLLSCPFVLCDIGPKLQKCFVVDFPGNLLFYFYILHSGPLFSECRKNVNVLHFFKIKLLKLLNYAYTSSTYFHIDRS